MKINFNYFKENELNKLTDEEVLILDKYFKGDKKYTINDPLENELTVTSKFYEVKALSENRRNIVEFYPIDSTFNVLEIGAGFGEITGSFISRAKNVVAIESKKEKAEAIGKRFSDADNLTIYAGEIEEIKLDEKFDIVSLIGVIDLKTDLDKYIDFAKSYLKDSGKILIAIDNKFGAKYFTGVKKDNFTKVYNTIVEESKYIGIEDIENKVNDLGFNCKKYYPMPDYTFTNAIYTDEFLPSVDHIVSRDLECFDTEINHVNFSERDVFKTLASKDKNLFKYICNSYLLVIGKDKLDLDLKAITYGTFRKPEYRIKTIIGEKEVYKTTNSNESLSHIKNIERNINILNECKINCLDSFDGDIIKSRYVEDGKTLDKVLLDISKTGDIELFISKVLEFKNEVLDKLEKIDVNETKENVFDKYKVNYNKDLLNKLTFVKYGLYDLISQNVFVIDDKFYAYDQEWMEENMPLEYILYRTILYLPEVRNNMDENEIYKKIDLIEYLETFYELDEVLQSGTKNEVFWNTHLKSLHSIARNIAGEKNAEEIETRIKELEKTISEKNAHIRDLEIMIADSNEKIASYETQIATISNSLSWKLTKPFRFLWWIVNPFSGASFIDRIMPPGGRRRIKYDEKLTKKLWEKKIAGYRAATDEEGVEYWKGIEHRERLLRERTEERRKLNALHNYEHWMMANELSLEEIELQRKTKFKKKPKISIVVPLYNTPEDLFRELIFNLYRQTYTNWELCLADGSKDPLENIQKMCKDPRIKYKFLGKNLGISGNSNEGLKMVTGDWVALLDHDDLLKVDALYEIVKVINERPNVRFIYTDEDKMTDIDNPRFDAHLKPDFSPDYLRGNNYICHFSVFKKEVMDKLEGFRDEYNGAQDLDIILRMTEIVEPKDIYHIPKVVYHWRICETSTAGNPETKLYAYESGRKAVEDHIKRLGLGGTVERDPKMYGIYRVKYDVDQKNEKVSIIVYGANSEENLSRCLESIKANTEYSNYEILTVENIGDNLYSALNSKVKEANGKFVTFVNGNIEFNDSRWLTDLVGFARRNDIGAVGGKILDESGKVVFAGRAVNSTGVIDLNIGLDSKGYGYFAKECHIQNISSVALNLMIVSKEKFDKVGGFNEEYKYLSDVDLNLKLLDEGYLNVYNPYVKVTCFDVNNNVGEEVAAESKKIVSVRNISFDKYFNINFNQEKNNYEIRKDKVSL